LPAAVAERARDSLALAERIGGTIGAHAQSAFVDGMHVALLCGAAVVVAAAIGVALLLRTDRATRRELVGDGGRAEQRLEIAHEGR
jgi:hypothetical protein